MQQGSQAPLTTPRVVLCGHLGRLGIDAVALGAEVHRRVPDAEWLVARDVCRRPWQLGSATDEVGATRVALGVCSARDADEMGRLFGRPREDGRDLVPVDLRVAAAVGDPAVRLRHAGLLLALALEVGSCSRPVAGGRLSLAGEEPLSRRELLSGVLTRSHQVLELDLARLAATIELLAAEPDGGPLLLRCSRAPATLPPSHHVVGVGGVVAVAVPSLGSVTAGVVLQALLAGVPAVVLVGCGGACCVDWETPVSSRFDFCARTLACVGEPPDRLRVVRAGDAPTPFGRRARPGAGPRHLVKLSEPRATARAIVGLARTNGRRGGRVASPGAPLGVVHLEDGSCTVCGACAWRCERHALRLVTVEARGELHFDPSDCSACGSCAAVCPERAIGVERVADVSSLSRGAVVLAAAQVDACVRCGRALEIPGFATAPGASATGPGLCSHCLDARIGTVHNRREQPLGGSA